MMIAFPVAAVVPAHNPDKDFEERLSKLREQCPRVVVVDDGSAVDVTVADAADDPDLIVLRQENLGIATALNNGIVAALERWPDLNYVLTVDQDSELGPDYLYAAIAAFEDATANSVRVGAVCAEKFNDRLVAMVSKRTPLAGTLQVAQSGMLFPRFALTQFGLFDPDLFIDCVDTEYALRMLKAGYKVLPAKGCVMAHPVGTVFPLELWGKPISVRGRSLKYSYHSAIRRYYISRNRILVYRKYFWVAPLWNARDVLAETRTAILSLLWGAEKAKQLAAISVGLWDGLGGRTGQARPRVKRILGAS